MTDHYEKAKQAWETAGKLVQGDRRETHGDFKTNFQAIAEDRKSTRLNSSHVSESRMPSSA